MGRKVVSSLPGIVLPSSIRTITTVLIASASTFVLAGCAAVQVHLGMKVYLSKVPVSSIDVQQEMAPGIGPGQKSSLIATITETKGKTLKTEGAGHGKVMWRDLAVTPTIVAVNKKGVISLRHDPRPTQGQLPHVTVTIPSHPGLHADLDVPLRYDYAFSANFSGASGTSGLNGTDGQDGLGGNSGSSDPNNPSPGGDGGNGTDGSNGQDGSPGGDAPAVQIDMTVADGAHPLLQILVQAGTHQRYYLVDPNGGSLSVSADGGAGGSGGRGGRGGRGGLGGVGTPSGSNGRDGSDGRAGFDGSQGKGGRITVTYDPSAQAYLDVIHLSSRNGPKTGAARRVCCATVVRAWRFDAVISARATQDFAHHAVGLIGLEQILCVG